MQFCVLQRCVKRPLTPKLYLTFMRQSIVSTTMIMRSWNHAQNTAYLHICELPSFEKEFAECSARVKRGGPKQKDLSKLSKMLKFDQKEGRQFLPLGASVWRGNIRVEWWIHVKPLPRLCEKLEEHPDQKTCVRAVLQKAWNTFNFLNGKPVDRSPVEGLFFIEGEEHLYKP